MPTQYTPILQLALPVTGELNGTWGDVVNDNITSMVEEAIAGLATISTWTANSHTLTTADGVTDEARCAMLVATTGSGGTALSAAGEIICPARTKLFVLQNNAAYAVTLKTASGSGVAVAAGDSAFLFCDGTNVNACVTQIINGHITGNLTVDGNATVNGNTTLGNATSDTITATARFNTDLLPSADNTYDLGTSGNSWRNLYIDGTATIATLNVTTIDTTNLEVTNIKAKDGTSSITLADSTGVATLSANPILNAGTANGVLYLNGSKSASSGSTLTWNGSTLAITGNLTATTDSSFTSTGALLISKGTTGEQPGSPVTGMMRYNTTTNQFEGYSGASPAWKSIGGSALSNDTSTASFEYPVFASATTGTAENLYTSNAKYLYKPSTGELQSESFMAGNGIVCNSQTVATSYTLPTGYNGMSAGPVTVNSGVTVTVPSGATWVIA